MYVSLFYILHAWIHKTLPAVSMFLVGVFVCVCLAFFFWFWLHSEKVCVYFGFLLRWIAVVLAVTIVHVDQFVVVVRILCGRTGWVCSATGAIATAASAAAATAAALRFVFLLHSLVLGATVLEPNFYLSSSEMGSNGTKMAVVFNVLGWI